MTTATDIQKQLEEAWESAEPGPFGADDAIIIQRPSGEYSVRPHAGYDSEGAEVSRIRVLERAKPKAPEWEAVVASYIHDEEHLREAFVRTASGSWESPTRYLLPDELVDPVPLVDLPERGALVEALEGPFLAQGAWEWPGSIPLANAVLELLRGERRA